VRQTGQMEPTSAPDVLSRRSGAELLDLLLGGLDLAEAVVSSVDEQYRHARTPCPEMDVEQLVAHVVAGMRWFAGLPLGEPAGPPGTADPELAGQPLGAAFAEAARAVRRAWAPVQVESSFPMPWGVTSGQEMAAFMAVEVIGHAWDVAVASHQPSYPVDDLARAALEVAHDLDEETLRSPGMLAAPVPVEPGAPDIARLAGFLGRDPHWWSTDG
jgi:uncharacterized protein (TIGR03086 family)